MLKQRSRFLFACCSLLCFSSLAQQSEQAVSIPVINETSAAVDSLNRLADSLLYLQIRDPFPVVAHALQTAEAINYKNGIAECYFNIAQIHRFITGDYSKALTYYNRSIELVKDHNYLIWGRCLIGKSTIALLTGETWKARPLLLEASDILIKGNSLSKSLSYEMRSHLFVGEMSYDSALTFLNKALKIQQENHQPPRRIAYTLGAISELAVDAGDSVQAKKYLSQEIDISLKYDLKADLSFANYLKAKMFFRAGHYSKAVTAIVTCLNIERQLQLRSPHSWSHYQLAGRCYTELGKFDSALFFFRRALRVMKHNKSTKALTCQAIADLFRRQSKIDSAFHYASLSGKLFQEISIDGRSNLSELELVHNSKLRDRENQLFQSSIRANNMILIATCIALTLSLLLIYLLYTSRRKHKALGLDLAAKNDEIAAQSEEIFAQSEELALHSQMLESSNANLKNLDDAGKAIIGSLDMEQIIDTTFNKVSTFMKLSSFGIGIFDESKEILFFPRAINEGRAQVPFSVSLNDHTNLQAWCFLNLQAVCVSDIYAEHHKYLSTTYEALALREEDVSFICCPLFYHEQGTGVIYASHQLPNSFSDHDLDIIKNIANYVSIAIENAKAHDQLAEEHSQLADSNALKDKLISIITHDIKGPLNSLKNFLQLLDNQAIVISDAEVLIRQLKENFGQTVQMVDSVLVWARSQMNGIRVCKTNFNIRLVIDRVKETLSEQAYSKKINIKNTIDDNYVFADEVMIELIVRNLIANAIKFTHVGGEVILSSDKNSEFLKICIEDNGIGMSQSSVGKLFQIHNRFTTHGTQKERGTGLGLYLCKEFILKNGGDIWVESEPGVGSKFYFSIPLLPASPDVLEEMSPLSHTKMAG